VHPRNGEIPTRLKYCKYFSLVMIINNPSCQTTSNDASSWIFVKYFTKKVIYLGQKYKYLKEIKITFFNLLEALGKVICPKLPS
jgi:hypothetical protein